MRGTDLDKWLTGVFDSRDVRYGLRHFSDMVGLFQKGDWEHSIAKGGKFIEAVLKALNKHGGSPCPEGREFKVASVVDKLRTLPRTTADDTIRVVIPRACRFIYDISSNRGGRHDPHEIDPNRMDSVVTVTCCSWILAEMVRYASRGKVDVGEAGELVERLIEKKYPLIEDIDGRVYLHLRNKSARDVALAILAFRHPMRMRREHLISSVKRNGFSENNSRMAVKRIGSVVDTDDEDNLRLLQTGLREAEELLRKSTQRN